MFSARPSSVIRANRCGVALVIVLAFVVLLTGLVLAFFSRAISERQISNSSANGVRVDVLTESAVATVLGDLRQEIAAGSKITQPAAGVNVYTPNAPATAVPCLAGTATTDPLPNLLKRSANGVAFFANASASTAYDTTNYPPSNRASSVPSTVASQNGRIITPARWNKPLLLPKNDPASDTVFTPINAFKAPDWVVIARNGTNPTTWDGKLAASGSNAAVGRFAYNIYDEGGLLDINAAGYPKDTVVATPQLNYPAYKQSLAFADLQQLPGIATTGTDSAGRTINGLSPSRQEQVVRTLVGWRNYASTGIDLTQNMLTAGQPVSGSVSVSPGYSWSSKPSSGNVFNYFNFMQVYGVGFMHTVNPLIVNGQSDRSFGSRQQLIDLVLNSVADQSTTATADRANLQNAMQYLGTFSRSLNQPSYTPAFPNDPDRPATQGPTSAAIPIAGGNEFGANSLATDNIINPSFLAVRVPATKTGGRNDGTDLLQGEPLVKKRFALNRLAWLTYLGPSADNMGNASVQATIRALGGNPANANDPVYKFVAQGTAQNIYNYFGLSWVRDTSSGNTGVYEWVYSHDGTVPLTASSAAVAAPIRKLDPAANPNPANSIVGREADFFELLRASITLGSLGKSYTSEIANSTSDPYTVVRANQTTRDQSVDAHVMQIGANIIDQFDSDGYPTRILFNNGLQGKIQEYRGVEDLPYIYRVRASKMRTVDAKVTVGTNTVGYTSLPVVGGTVVDPGKGVFMQTPEVWNPHFWNPNTPDTFPTIPRPTNFRVIALTDPGIIPSSAIKLTAAWRSAVGVGGTKNGAYNSPTTTSPGQDLNAANTEMLFNVPANGLYLFREPTILNKPNVPGGSALHIGADLTHNIYKLTSGGSYFTSLDAAVNPAYSVTDDKRYIGFPLGGETLPLAWSASPSLATGAIDGLTNPATASPGVVPAELISVNSGTTIIYQMQYQTAMGSGWCTYDEKYAPIVYTSSYDSWANSNIGSQKYGFMKDVLGNNEMLVSAMDPRTDRFGMHYMGRGARGQQGQFDPPDPTWSWPASMAYQNAEQTNRPDEYQGFIFDSQANSSNGPSTPNCGASALGWYVGGSPSTLTSLMRPGLISQNNPSDASATSPLRFSGDPRGTGYVFASGLTCFADADGVVRRAMGAHVQPTTSTAATITSGVSGQPLKTAYNFSTSTAFGNAFSITDNGNAASRPMMLNRPFHSVTELGYTFSDTPWRNLDFFTPESGNAAMLDVFCVNDAGDVDGVVAGQVNLNTRQAPVMQAIVAGAYRDESAISSTTVTQATGNASANLIAQGLVILTGDTATGTGPLRNVSELVGKWVKSQSGSLPVAPFNVDGGLSYKGFSGTQATVSAPSISPAPALSTENLSDILTRDTTAFGYATGVAQRYRESAIRALSTVGQTRVWNVMIDLVVQTGRYPQSVSSLDKFLVEGEQRCWVHLAIDRYTGAVIDKQIEIIKE